MAETETYKGSINEFIDWVTGSDSFTGRNMTDGLPVSGQSIRRLLQERLKHPLVVYEDEEAGLFRMFSSEAARDKWISGMNPQDPAYDPESVVGLEIFNFERPSDFVLGQVGLLQQPRYIIKGDSTSQDAVISFGVTLKDKNGQTKGDSIIVTYTITNVATGITKSFSEEWGESYVNNDYNKITRNIYEYLGDGQNTVNVNIKGRSTSNSIDIPFGVYLMEFSLSSSFDYAHAKKAGNDIEIPFEVLRSAVPEGSTLEVIVQVDGREALYATTGASAVYSTGDTSQRISRSMKIKGDYAAGDYDAPAVRHTLSIEATMVSGNTTFHSNVLYYTFSMASERQDLVNQVVNISTGMPYYQVNRERLVLRARQYEAFRMPWSYYTDQIQNQQSVTITFALKRESDEAGRGYEYIPVGIMTGVKGETRELAFIPETYTRQDEDMWLVAMLGNSADEGQEIASWPIIVSQSSLFINETQGYDLKLSAYGKSNSSPTKDVWRDEQHDVDVNFSQGVGFDSTAGWDDNSLHLSGEDAYATIGYCPFPVNFASTGRVIAFKFKTEQVNDEDDVLIDIGSAEKGRITVTPSRATLTVGGTEIVSTHFKANEVMDIAFIFNKADAGLDSNLVYIINNGILERAADIGTADGYVDSAARIKVGGTNSGIRLYSVYAYPMSIGYQEAYDNYVYNAEDRASIIGRNDIMDGGAIIYDKCRNKIDTVLIEGDLGMILNKDANKKDSESTVSITVSRYADSSKNFTLINGMLRKHGQSTLNYPISSMKMWLNKSATAGVNPVLTLSTLQAAMGLNKNRYVMKDGAIPANKFVLQANYADSSGGNNGAIERLIQRTWYDAVIDGEHKLRTAPQLFASGEIVNHNNADLGETGGNAWIEGYGTDSADGKTWKDIAQKAFPYEIRVSADSFPCAVFYRNTKGTDSSIHFLGQYVFMDDKKSDFLYGERSIYHYYDETDPFCLKLENKSEDTKANRVWDNDKVVRIECVLLDNVLTSFMDYHVPRFSKDTVNSGANVPCDAVKYDEKGEKLNFYWEDYFEMIYPDPDDFEVKVNGVKVPEDKFAEGSGFREKAKYFTDFLKWITSIGQLNKTNGRANIDGTVTAAALNEFKATAARHLDLYKLAAYYIFFLRLGLVDSVERNAQWKTYDGQHWHCEPWDMDIAVGNKNDGGFAFDPPVNRNTRLASDQTKYAFSGRSTTTSNVLWDCLEAWDYWRDTVVPKVAQALYTAGLRYEDIVYLFDEGYSNQWSETMYNESGHYKYVEMRAGSNDWLRWLQGASISHRHWWLSISMNYYDAMWTAGDFNNHRIYIAAEKTSHQSGTDLVTIKPTNDTFFKMTQNDGNSSLGVLAATRKAPAVFDLSAYSFSVKDPSHIYGATFIEELDLRCFAQKLSSLSLGGAYDKVLGAPIKMLLIGTVMTRQSSGEGNDDYGLGAIFTGTVSGTSLNLNGTSLTGNETVDALENLQTLDITGQQSIVNTQSLLYTNNRRMLKNLYAVGTGLISFITSMSGNKFSVLRLPSATVKDGNVTNYLQSMTLIDSTWEDLSFWTTETTSTVTSHTETDDEGNVTEVIEANPAVFTNTGIPATMKTIVMEGSTASNLCAAELVMGWLKAIEESVAAANPALTGDALEASLLETLKGYTLRAENIRWGTADVPVKVSYKDLSRMAALNQGNNQNANLKGYILISDKTQLTSVQLTQLREWFGESVFNKSNINSGLIIDQQLGETYVQINVGGDAYSGVDENHEEAVFLREGGTATLNATQFLLSESSETYNWSISSESVGYSASLTEGADGIMRLTAHEGAIGDYVLTVTAFKDNVSRSVNIHVVGVTYPTDWHFGVREANGTPLRKFNASTAVLERILGANLLYQYGSSSKLRETYVFYNAYQQFEFYIESVGAEGATATLRSVEYEVVAYDTEGSVPRTDASQFRGDGTAMEMIDEGVLYYTNGAQHAPVSGIVLATRDQIPADIKRYVLTARISIGGKTEIRYLNLMAMADSAPVVELNVLSSLYVTLKNIIDPNLNRHIYKTDLMALEGTLKFNDTDDVQLSLDTLVARPIDGQVKSIFAYLPNITELDLSRCNFSATDLTITGTDKRVLNLSGMGRLTSVVLSGASVTGSAPSELTVDVSGCDGLVSFAAEGTSVGIRADGRDGGGSYRLQALRSIALGSPYEVFLKDTAVLSAGGVSVESSANLASVHIENVNRDGVTGFGVFNRLV